jgi:hypothetical protein
LFDTFGGLFRFIFCTLIIPLLGMTVPSIICRKEYKWRIKD